jgi:hypothetical protein
MGNWKFNLAVAALALAWLAEGLFVRLTGWIPGRTRGNDLAGWGTALKKPMGDEAPARRIPAKQFAGGPGFVTGGGGAAAILAGPGRKDGLPQPNNK